MKTLTTLQMKDILHKLIINFRILRDDNIDLLSESQFDDKEDKSIENLNTTNSPVELSKNIAYVDAQLTLLQQAIDSRTAQIDFSAILEIIKRRNIGIESIEFPVEMVANPSSGSIIASLLNDNSDDEELKEVGELSSAEDKDEQEFIKANNLIPDTDTK